VEQQVRSDENEHLNKNGHIGSPQHVDSVFGEHPGSPLGQVLQWFKTMSTNEYIRKVKSDNWPGFDGKLWQRDYWEHIIRNERSCNNIAAYIRYNPENWDIDSINPGHKNK
jgi:REP element-mobilizing transposase RayT